MAEKETMKKIAALFLLALLLRLVFLQATPFNKDEALYAEIIDEMARGAGLIPHYASVIVPWKPPLAFWVYSSFAQAFNFLPVPIEILYRLPGILLGALCPVLSYLIMREITKDDDLSFISGIAYAGCGLAIVVSMAFLTDTVLAVLTLSSLLCYLKSPKDWRLSLLGGLLAALAIFTKTLAGVLGVALGMAYFLLYDRKQLAKKEFLASLLLVPLAFAALYLFIPGIGGQYSVDSTQRIATTPENIGHFLGANLGTLTMLAVPWLVIALFGIYKYQKELPKNLFFFVWLAVGLAPLFSLGPLPWYFLPLIPVISIFASKVVLAGGKADSLAIGIALFLVLISMAPVYLYQGTFSLDPILEDSRQIGSGLSGHDALLVMHYNPTMVYYKFRGDADYGSLDAFFVLNETVLNDKEMQALILNSTLPNGSVTLQDAVTQTPYLLDRFHLGNFSKPHSTIVLDKALYSSYVENRTEYSGLEKASEDELFVILKRK